jgi:hypothetical protein
MDKSVIINETKCERDHHIEQKFIENLIKTLTHQNG